MAPLRQPAKDKLQNFCLVGPCNGVWGLVPSGSRAEPWPYCLRAVRIANATRPTAATLAV
jgi:hypothetical protein